jgi:hypothetical protein
LFLDGVLVHDLAEPVAEGYGSSEFSFNIGGGGIWGGTGNFFEGRIDEVAVFGRALAVDEIAELANLEPVATPPSLKISYPQEGATVTEELLEVVYISSGDLTGVDRIYQRVDNGSPTPLTSLSGTTTISDLGPGIHTISLTLVNANGAELLDPQATASVTVTKKDGQVELLDCSDPTSRPQVDDDFEFYTIGQRLNQQSSSWEYACEHFSDTDDYAVVCDHDGDDTGDRVLGHAACSDGITNGAGCSTYTPEAYPFLKVCVELDAAEVTREQSTLNLSDAAAGGDENDAGYFMSLHLPNRISLARKPSNRRLAINDRVDFGEGDVVCLAYWDNAGTPTLTGTINGEVAVETTAGLIHEGPFQATVFICRDQSDLTLLNAFDDFGVAECRTNR